MTSPSPSEPRTPRLYHAAFAPVTAVKLAAVSVATVWAVQTILYAAGTVELVAAVVSDLAVIAVLVVVSRGRGGVAALGLRRVAPRFVIAGILFGIAAWYPALRLVVWARSWLELGDTRLLERIVEQTALVPTLFAIGVMPAIAEEMVFRGVLARGLATRWPVFAVLGSTVAFCGFHLLPAQMLGVLPIGLALGYLAIRADSIVPTMIAHLVNNLIGVVLSRGTIPSAITDPIDAHPNATLAVALACVGGGIALAGRGTA
jgi:membrane protease YdiL (CAAX protease family)